MVEAHLKYAEILANYMPPEAANLAAHWIMDYKINLRITRARNSKLGDYRPPSKPGEVHQITINFNLNPYAFLITFVHEVAHLTTHIKYGHKVKAHGNEWKAEFRGLMRPYFEMGVFPEDVAKALIRYLGNPAAASCTDVYLQKVLKNYDSSVQRELGVHLEELNENDKFVFRNRVFVKGSKIRKRYRCLELKTKHLYLFSPVTLVQKLT